jgi:hypothetical protein
VIDAVDVLILLTLHYLADFECQTDWMATNKSKSWRALSAHVGVYTLVLTAGMLAWASISLIPASVFPIRLVEVIGWPGMVAFAVATFVTHFVTDAVTSRVASRRWFFTFVLAGKNWRTLGPGVQREEEAFYVDIGDPHRYFCWIGLDQLIHAWTLTLTWAWVTR